MIREADLIETAGSLLATEGSAKSARTKLSPNELAAQWGVARKTILALIRSRQLPAIDISPGEPGRGPGRRTFLIDVGDIAIFEERRTIQPPERKTQRRRKKKSEADGITKFF